MVKTFEGVAPRKCSHQTRMVIHSSRNPQSLLQGKRPGELRALEFLEESMRANHPPIIIITTPTWIGFEKAENVPFQSVAMAASQPSQSLVPVF